MNRRAFFILASSAALGAFDIRHRTDRLPPITVPTPNPNTLPEYMYASDGKPGLGIWQLQQANPHPPIVFGNQVYWATDGTRPLEASQAAMLAAACCK